MLAAALGLRRDADLARLNALKFGVRADREGEDITDFHMAHSEKSSYVTYRHYLCDAVFLAGLEGEEELLKELAKYPQEDIYIIGGESVYRMMLPYCDVAHVTKIDHAYEADAYFPDIDRMPEWVLTGESEEKTYFDLEFRFCRYERREA